MQAEEKNKRPDRGSKNKIAEVVNGEEKPKATPKKKVAKVTVNTKSKNNTKKK